MQYSTCKLVILSYYRFKELQAQQSQQFLKNIGDSLSFFVAVSQQKLLVNFCSYDKEKSLQNFLLLIFCFDCAHKISNLVHSTTKSELLESQKDGGVGGLIVVSAILSLHHKSLIRVK